MAAAKKDKRVSDVQKYLKVVDGMGIPDGDASERACWVIMARHGSNEGATKALEAIRELYVDMNEFRVARPFEVMSIIGPHLKNDALTVAETLHGFLWRFHKDHHTMDYGRTGDMTPTQFAKYFAEAEGHVLEMGLAVFLHYAADEHQWILEESMDEKPRKRTEREATVAFEKMAMACALAVHGSMPAKTKIGAALRQFAKAWAFKSMPKPPKRKPVRRAPPVIATPTPPPAAKKAASKAAAGRKPAPPPKAAAKPAKKAPAKTAKKAVAKKTAKKATKKATKKVAKKAAPKKAAKKAAKKAGGAARPKTTRPNRARTNKSSRR